MNVVEKEASLREGLESSSSDIAAPFKVARTSIVLSNSKPGRAAPYREPRPLGAAEVRRFISERSNTLQAFVAPLEEEVRRVSRYKTRARRNSRLAVGKVAELVLSIIRKLAHRETGIFSLDPNVPLLLSNLYAGSVEATIISGLVRRAQAALAAVARAEQESSMGNARTEVRTGEHYDVARELEELTMLLKWYVRRKMSLAGLEVDHLRDGDGTELVFDDNGQEQDALFGFEILHDHQVFGAKGCFVTCGLRLVGHDGQPLWLRVAVRWNGSIVSVRPEWSSWTDPGGLGPVEVVPESAPFCSLVPIRPNAQRIVIDDIRAFVPYAALDLPAGRCDVELVVSIVDNDGREIISAARGESICVPRRELVFSNVPAPHSVGMWPHDVVSGDRISELSVASGYKVVAGWERHTISVSFDLSLFMHAGESVLLECRFLNERGELVELSSLGIPYVASDRNVPVESVSSYRYRRILHPKSAWSYFRGLCIDIPVEFLLLEAGHHNLTCEVVIVSSDDRVLCGDMGLVSLQVPGTARASETREDDGAAAADGSIAATIELESIEIDPTWQFAGEESVRIQATFCPKNPNRQLADLAAGRVGELFSPYRVEISIEREDGHQLLQAFSDALGLGFKPVTRGICVEGHSGFTEHSVVASFAKDEILAWSFGSESYRGISKMRLFARVRALSLDGIVILQESKEFFIKPLAAPAKRTVEVGSVAPAIVDVVAHTYVQSPRLSCRVLINIPHGHFLQEGVVVAYTLISSSGNREQIAKKTLSAPHSAAWVRQQMGLSQVPVELDYRLSERPSRDLAIEVALLTEYDEVIQAVQQAVRTAGVLAEAESSPEAFPNKPANGAVSSLEASSLHPFDVEPGKKSSGIFSWLRR